MTELEKAASGLLYDAISDPALLEARAQTSDLCMDYNALRSSQKEEKNALLHTILGACAPDIVIEPPFFVDYGSHTRVGVLREAAGTECRRLREAGLLRLP